MFFYQRLSLKFGGEWDNSEKVALSPSLVLESWFNDLDGAGLKAKLLTRGLGLIEHIQVLQESTQNQAKPRLS